MALLGIKRSMDGRFARSSHEKLVVIVTRIRRLLCIQCHGAILQTDEASVRQVANQ